MVKTVVGVVLGTGLLLMIGAAYVAYPAPEYEYIYPGDPRYTGQVIDFYEDRASGWEVQRRLVDDHGNPAWVMVLRGDVGLFGIFAAVVGMSWACSGRSTRGKSRRQTSRSV